MNVLLFAVVVGVCGFCAACLLAVVAFLVVLFPTITNVSSFAILFAVMTGSILVWMDYRRMPREIR